jgi:hypothetical protein
MKTTELFAELLVIGVGAVCACILLVLAVVPALSSSLCRLSTVAIIPALAVIYLFGILADRFCDILFDAAISKRRRGLSEDDLTAWKIKRDAVVMSSTYAAGLYSYGRSRQRILRAWTLNSVALAVSSFVYLTTRECAVCGVRVAILSLSSFLGLGILCFVIWNRMDKEEVSTIDRISRRTVANLRKDTL